MPLDSNQKFLQAMKLFETHHYRKALDQFSNLALDLTLKKKGKETKDIEKAMEMAIHSYRKINSREESELSIIEDVWNQFFNVMRHYMDDIQETDSLKIEEEISMEIPLGAPEGRSFETAEGKPHFEKIQTGPYLACIASAQGPREAMEDAHLACQIKISGKEGKEEYIQIFAVFDGHGGAACALWVKQNLPDLLRKEFEEAYPLSDISIYNCLRKTFICLNKEWEELPFQKTEHQDYSGTTATVALLFERNTLWVANVGDSRTVLLVDDRAIQLSEEAKATVIKYEREIYLRGGEVQYGRVIGERGSLDMARSIGDIDQPAVSALPTIRKMLLPKEGKEDLYLLLGCDGLWDVVSPITAAEVSANSESAEEIARHLEKLAFASGTTDNVSVMVIKL